MNLRSARTVRLDGDDPVHKRQEIRDYFHRTVDIEEKLFETLKSRETFFLRPDPLRHPLIFYFGHTAAFYINKLVTAKLREHRIDPAFESMFAIGVDEMSWDDLDESHYDWPTPEAVQAYRDQVRETVDQAIQSLPLSLPIGWDSPFWVIMMGIEHQRIHLETSSVLIRQLPIAQVQPHPLWDRCRHAGDAPVNSLLPVGGGTVVLGKDKSHPLYGWDNEYGRHEAQIAPFQASRYLVSNGEFMEFVAAGGYREQRWWTEEGWRWRGYRDARHPVFWVADGEGEYRLRTLLEVIDMPWNWPVEVNYLEAKAFCNWKSARSDKPLRLPTEDEWARLRDEAGVSDQPEWADAAPGNINLEHYASPCPVDTFRWGAFHDVIGNVWQWSETPIDAFPGFTVHPVYDDFSTPTFDSRHNLIKGGSWISTGNEATRDARYAFRRHFFQHAGFRYVASEQPVVIKDNPYETDALVAQYAEFHYGEPHFGVPNFPAALAQRCRALIAEHPTARALDIGCAVGRLTFELARRIPEVTGLDFSARFIRLATEMKEQGSIRYVLPEEGELMSYHEITLASLALETCRERVQFYQADACNLAQKYHGYDLIVAANLIDRLYQPRKFLAEIHARLNPGGLLVIASPYTWLAEYTPREEWLGGFKENGETLTTLEAMEKWLAPHFQRLGEPEDIPFVIRETQRKFQHSLTEMTVWRRTD